MSGLISELAITEERARTFSGISEKGKGIFKNGERLEQFGKNQDEFNLLLMNNFNEMKRRIALLEQEHEKVTELYKERLKRCAEEIVALKKQVDLLKLSQKQNNYSVKAIKDELDLLKRGKNCEPSGFEVREAAADAVENNKEKTESSAPLENDLYNMLNMLETP